MSATDDDLDLNREIVYSIESGGANTFFIDCQFEIVYLKFLYYYSHV